MNNTLSISSLSRSLLDEYVGDIKSVDGYADDDAVHVMFDDDKEGLRGDIRGGGGKREGERKGQAFFFGSGAVVFWGMDMRLRRRMMESARRFQEDGEGGSKDEEGGMMELGEFDHEFRFRVDGDRRRSGIRNDELLVRDFEDSRELLALSYGLGQSVKLLVYEEALDRLVETTKRLPRELARFGKIGMSGTDIKKLMGELMTARYSVNLLSDILDTPEFFWNHPHLDDIYMEVCKAVELSKRAEILNERVEVIKDALDILNNELHSSSSNRVERAILFLIAIEVLFEFTGRFL